MNQRSNAGGPADAGQTALLAARVQQLEAALSQLSGSIGHDLRAPLRIASGYLSMLREDHGDALGDDARGLLAVAERQLEHMGGLLAALLSLSDAGSQPLEIEAVPMALLAAETAALATADGTVTLHVGPLHDARCDRLLVRQVWRQLLDNAYRFTRAAAHPAITISSRRIDDMVRYTVRDNGIGFDRGRAERLFEPFTRLHAAADDPGEGAGVGLAIARCIVERHGGRIVADSRPQHGTTIEFTLPAVP